ncbi:MAG: B12-binding domain-containing radical SAM protein [Candidatus Aenigmatarchaeota archaeon]|nr:MAG: B12-binding domain-containing radical SAM protein [Candidatus Aenigmarchaeota archaeon]
MKILFIQQDVFKNYGIMMLSAILKKNGHECDILIDCLEKDLTCKIKSIKPYIIGFSITTTRYSWMIDLAKMVKSKFKIPILVGGPHPTFFPEIINEDFIDIVCIGEGEYAILELLDKLENGEDINNIKNLWVKEGRKIFRNQIRNLIEDLDSLPYADRDLYKKYTLLRNQNTDVFMASRGCPYNCTFCFNKRYNNLYRGKGKILRRRSILSLINEIKRIVSNNRNVNYLIFLDDTFILGPRNWFIEFLTKYKHEIGLPFSITARADLVDEEIIKILKEAGCNSIRMGIESANPYLREKVLKKEITNKQIEYATKVIKNNKIKLQLYNILGTPGETLDTALETYELSYKLHPHYAWCSLMQPYPGTEIMEIAKEQKLIREDYGFEDLDNSYFSTLPLNITNKKEIVNLQKLFQFGNVFRIPKSLIKILIKLPYNRIFELIFKINYAIGIKRMDNLSWNYVFRVSMHSKGYFRKQESLNAARFS